MSEQKTKSGPGLTVILVVISAVLGIIGMRFCTPVTKESEKVLELKGILRELYLYETNVTVAREVESIVPIYELGEGGNQELLTNIQIDNFKKNPFAYKDVKLPERDRENNKLEEYIKKFEQAYVNIVVGRKEFLIPFDKIPEEWKYYKFDDMGYIYNKKQADVAFQLLRLRESLMSAAGFYDQLQENLGEDRTLSPLEHTIDAAIATIEIADSLDITTKIPLYQPIVYIAIKSFSGAGSNNADLSETYKKALFEIVKDKHEDIYLKKIAVTRLLEFASKADEKLTDELLKILKEEAAKRREKFAGPIGIPPLIPNDSKQYDPEAEYIKELIKLTSAYVNKEPMDVDFKNALNKN